MAPSNGSVTSSSSNEVLPVVATPRNDGKKEQSSEVSFSAKPRYQRNSDSKSFFFGGVLITVPDSVKRMLS